MDPAGTHEFVRSPVIPVPLAHPANPGQHRKQRLWFLRLLGQSARVVLLLLSLAGLGALLLVRDPVRTQQLQDWLADQITHQPKSLLRAAEQAMERKDYAAAASAARQFMRSIPLPLPVDAFGESYRTALRILRESAEKSGDLPAQLAAGRMAQQFDPHDTAALFDHGRALRKSGDLTRAADTLEAAFAIRPFSAPIVAALESLYAATGDREKSAIVHTRHLEAVALCLNQNAWLSGNLVYYGGGETTAQDIQLDFPAVTDLTVVFDRRTEGAYLVLKGLPHLRLIFEQADLTTPAQGSMPLPIEPQQSLRRIDGRTAESAFTPGADFDAPAVVGLSLKAAAAPGSVLHVRIRVEPDAELEPWVRKFGTWHHPRVPVAPAAEN